MICRTGLRLLPVMLLSALFFHAEAANQSASRIHISFAMESAKLSLREPVVLIFTVQNQSENSATVDLGQDRKENFLFSLMRPDGTSVRLPQLRSDGFSILGVVSIEPGKHYVQQIVLNEWSEFEQLGSYKIRASLAKPVRVGRASEGELVVEADFQILPKQPEKLLKVCDALLRRVYSAPSYEATAEAALALSYVRDPIAIPHLRKMLVSGLVEGFALKGLQRIGNREAVQVLIAAYGEGPGQRKSELQQRAGGALSTIARETRDPELRKDIMRALHQK